MATTVKPPPRRATKGDPPAPTRPSQNLTKPSAGELQTLNFKVPPEFHQEFKMYAAGHGMSMVELLQRSFAHYKESTK